MPKYKTLDQRIKWQGQYIGPDTEITVSDEEAYIWDALVRQRAAIKLEEGLPKSRRTRPRPEPRPEPVEGPVEGPDLAGE